MPVWAEISSPAQSLASDRKSPSGASSGFCPWSLNFLASSFSLCFSSSLKGSTSFYWQWRLICWWKNISQKSLTCVHRYCWANLVTMTDIKPRRKVKIDERRKHHHFLSLRHSSYSIRGMPLKRKIQTLLELPDLTSGAKVSMLSPIFILAVLSISLKHFKNTYESTNSGITFKKNVHDFGKLGT